MWNLSSNLKQLNTKIKKKKGCSIHLNSLWKTKLSYVFYIHVFKNDLRLEFREGGGGEGGQEYLDKEKKICVDSPIWEKLTKIILNFVFLISSHLIQFCVALYIDVFKKRLESRLW